MGSAQTETLCLDGHDQPEASTRSCMCGNAAQTLRDFSKGERRFFLSKGQFSLVDIAIALTHQIGPCDFKCAVWTSTEKSVDAIANLVESNRIIDAQWVLCDSQRSMNEDRLNRIVQLFGVESVRVVPLHAKLMTLRNDDWSITVQTSANMTRNRSVEQFDVTDGERLADFVDGFFGQVFEDTPPLTEEPPFDGWSYEDVEQRYQSMCLGNHFKQADVMDISPIGVSDGIK